MPKIRNDETESITYDDLIVSPHLKPKSKFTKPVINEMTHACNYVSELSKFSMHRHNSYTALGKKYSEIMHRDVSKEKKLERY